MRNFHRVTDPEPPDKPTRWVGMTLVDQKKVRASTNGDHQRGEPEPFSPTWQDLLPIECLPARDNQTETKWKGTYSERLKEQVSPIPPAAPAQF